MDYFRGLAEEMSMSMLGRRYDPSDDDTDEIRSLRVLILETVTRVLTRTHELECEKMTLQRLGGGGSLIKPSRNGNWEALGYAACTLT